MCARKVRGDVISDVGETAVKRLTSADENGSSQLQDGSADHISSCLVALLCWAPVVGLVSRLFNRLAPEQYAVSGHASMSEHGRQMHPNQQASKTASFRTAAKCMSPKSTALTCVTHSVTKVSQMC